LTDGNYNLYEPIREGAIQYFKDNNIGWWGGSKPSGHILSSQIACVNHHFLSQKRCRRCSCNPQ